MALTTLANVKTYLGITDSQEDTLLTQLLGWMQAHIAEYCGRVFEQANYTEILSGNDRPYLQLRYRPLNLIILTGTATIGSPTVTGLASTTGIVTGMPAVAVPATTGGPATVGGSLPFPPGTTVSSTGSTTATLSANATAGGSVQMFFGMEVLYDEAAYWGGAPGAFAAATQIIPGQDYMPALDQPGGQASRSGLLLNISRGFWPKLFQWQAGRIAIGPGPRIGTIKVSYNAGFATIPPDLEETCCMMIAQVRKTPQYGEILTSEHYEEYGSQMFTERMSDTLFVGLCDGTTGATLARYRNLTVA